MNAHGVLHGGVIATLADAAVAIATSVGRPAATTVEMKVNYLCPVADGTITRAIPPAADGIDAVHRAGGCFQ